MSVDIEKTSDEILYLPGYGSFSDIIASDDDHTSAIYRRFDKLATRDLLYYQSELAELQAEQDSYDKEDIKDVTTMSSDEWENIRRNAQSWNSLRRSGEIDTPDGRWRKRLDLAMEIRRVIREYREALLRDAQIRALAKPEKQSMKAMSKTFRASGYSVLTGASSNLYPDPAVRADLQDNDYVAVLGETESDLLTLLLKRYWPAWFGQRRSHSGGIKHATQPQLSYFSVEILNLTARFIVTFLAIGLLVAPMVSLYYVSKQKPGTTIGMIVMFTVLFAGTVALVTGAKRGEIFGATAAYAAVLVVFVSGNFASGGG